MRCIKSDSIFEALGDCDELNASIGFATNHLPPAATLELGLLNTRLSIIQSRLLDIGSAVATPLGKNITTLIYLYMYHRFYKISPAWEELFRL